MTVRTLADLKRRFRRGKRYDGQDVRDFLVSTYYGTLLDSVELAATQTTVTFSSIPDTFNHLLIRGLARCDTAAASHSGMTFQFNNDTASNYKRLKWQLTASSADGESVDSQGTWDRANIGPINIPAADATAGMAAQFEIFIANYKDTDFWKTCTVDAFFLSDVEQSRYVSGGAWENTAAITEIDFFVGTGDDFISGSKFYLYGLA